MSPQLQLWAPAPPLPEPPVIVPTDPEGLRAYQREAVNAWLDHTKTASGGRIVLFTSAGKNRIGAAVVRATKGRVLWLADFTHLLEQSRKTIEELCGEWTTIEQGKLTADGSRVVLGSVPTIRGARLHDWAPDTFKLIVYDEMQHSAANGARRILEHFAPAKRLGLTATDYRLDKKSIDEMGECVYRREIDWGIAEGYFCPIVPRIREIKSIDLSNVGVSMGDLKLSDLEKQIVNNAAPIAHVAWEESESGKLPTIVFTPGVASAKAVAATWNELAAATWGAGSCVSVDGDTPDGVRYNTLKNFGGSIRAITNCLIYGEGTDLPKARCIVLARKTKSRGLFMQQVGRGGRLFPGDIGQLPALLERLTAIRESEKPWFKLVDIAGNAGRHTLATIADTMAGELTPLEARHVTEAIRKPRRPDQTLDEAVEQGRKAAADEQRAIIEAEEKKIALAAATARVTATAKAWNPFKRFGVGEFKTDGLEPEWIAQPPTADQLVWLERNRMKGGKHTRGSVASLQATARDWQKRGLASFNQRRALLAAGIPVDISYGLASRIITHIKACRYNPRSWGPKVKELMAEGRIAGED